MSLIGQLLAKCCPPKSGGLNLYQKQLEVLLYGHRSLQDIVSGANRGERQREQRAARAKMSVANVQAVHCGGLPGSTALVRHFVLLNLDNPRTPCRNL